MRAFDLACGVVFCWNSLLRSTFLHGIGSERSDIRVAFVEWRRLRAPTVYPLSRAIRGMVARSGVDNRRGSLIQVSLDGKPVWRWVLIGFWPGVIGGGLWSVKLSRVQYFEIKGSLRFSKRIDYDLNVFDYGCNTRARRYKKC